MKEKIEFMKKGNFENLQLDEIKNNFKKFNINFNYYYDIKDNKEADFTQLTKIKSEFEEYILSINKDFEILSNEFHKNLGNIPSNLSYKLNNIFIDNFDMPL